jgi:2-dehydro-3-deoxyphosphogluconate aldolase/(4S)-4-hydroxy-2-oxoglutarate aldolase
MIDDVMTPAESLRRQPIVVIWRDVQDEHLPHLIELCVANRVTCVELTLNTPGAIKKIRRLVELAKGRLVVGAGTVLDVEGLEAAVEAGASFSVSPVNVPEVQARAVELSVPTFPGALTPQEVWQAHRAGAFMVKVFPAGCFGPSYFKELRGPFKQLPLLACGGVTPQNVKDYFAAGAGAVAIGASIFRPQWLHDGQWDQVGAALGEFVQAVERCTSELGLASPAAEQL